MGASMGDGIPVIYGRPQSSHGYIDSLLGNNSSCLSWTEIQENVGFFHFNLMSCLAGIIGVFLQPI